MHPPLPPISRSATLRTFTKNLGYDDTGHVALGV